MQTADFSGVLPPLLPGTGEVTPVTPLFRENTPGVWEAELSVSALPRSHVFLSFSRVGCRALLTVRADKSEKTLSCSHYGSFTDWSFEITEAVADSPVSLHVSLQLEADETTLSPYQRAGIFGEILIVTLPCAYLSDFYVRPLIQDGKWGFLVNAPAAGDCRDNSLVLELTLYDPDDACIAEHVLCSPKEPVFLSVSSPLLWNPDSPRLYRIRAALLQDKDVLGVWEKRAGLCSIQKDGQTVRLNGSPLKLRGLAYREPLDCEGFDVEADLRLFAEANVNYLRSLYYPFSSRLLSLCDEMGILVEQSAPVDEVGQTLPANQNAPALLPLFLGQYREMLLRDRSHPCILLWALGNNSVWGSQFAAELSLTRSLDPDRLVNFHLPMSLPQDEWIPDVWSVQYGAWNLPSDTCYDHMVIFHTQGADNAIGYATGKAQDYHLPVLHDVFAPVPVHDLDDLERDPGVHDFWGESVTRFWENIRTAPGALGGAVMAAVDEDGSFHPSLKDFCYGILDAHHQPKPEYWHLKMAYQEDPFVLKEEGEYLLFANSHISCAVCKETGLFSHIRIDKKTVLCGGPVLHTGRFLPGPWKLEKMAAEPIYKGIQLLISGSYGTALSVSFTVTLTEDGRLDTSCRIDALNRSLPHQVKSGIGLDPGGLDELAIHYLLPADMDTLSWQRDGLWADYPDDHIGRPAGTAKRSDPSDFTSMKANLLTAAVSSPDTCVQVIPKNGQGLRLDLVPDKRCMLSVHPDSSSPFARVRWDGTWNMIEDKTGGAYHTELMSRDKNASCTISFHGTGIVIYGSTDRIRGCCDIWIDGVCVAKNISQHTPRVQVACMSRGYEKRYHRVLFCIDSLAYGDHECRIIVTGEKEPSSQDTYISLDSFEILHPDCPRQVSLLVCMDYNYPRLVLGNYMRPACLPKAGDAFACRLYLKGGLQP